MRIPTNDICNTRKCFWRFILALIHSTSQINAHLAVVVAQGDIVALMGGDRAPCRAELLQIEEEHAAREQTGIGENGRVLFLAHQE